MNDDLISRQAAIDKLKEHRALYCDNTPDTFSILFYAEKIRVDELDTAIATLVNLPAAQPEIEPIDYTDKGKYLRACGFAISQMIERGSSAVVFSIHSDHPVQVRYEDVLEWIDKQLDVIGYSKDGNVSGVEEAEKGR